MNGYPTNIIVEKKESSNFMKWVFRSDILKKMSSTLDKWIAE